MAQRMNLFFDFDKASVYDIREVNSSFASGSLKVLYLGENRNGSYFSKDAVVRALPSLKNVPIVCHWDYDTQEIGGHDIELVVNDDGGMSIRNLTEPCGVVPDHARSRFVTEADDDGVEHEYLVVDGVLLWKRQDVYKHIVNDLGGKVKHSMEITVSDGTPDANGYYHVNDFEFTALCLLESYEPCFQGSELEIYSANNFKQKMEQMMADLKSYYTVVDSPIGNSDICNDDFNMEGGEKVLENKIETPEETVATTVDDSVNETTETFIQHESNDVEPQTEESTEVSEDIEEHEFALNSGFIDELIRVVSSIETVELSWGETVRYWYVDCDTDAHEVYCLDALDMLLYGFTYTVDGDAVAIDLDSKKRMKYAIVPFDGAEQVSPLSEIFALVGQNISNNAVWESKYQDASNHISTLEAELSELRKFKADIDANTAKAERDAVFSRFTDLDGIPSFEELREHADEYEISCLEEKCYAIRGRNTVVAKFNVNNKSNKLVVPGINENSNEPYGGLFTKYASVIRSK